MKSILLFFYNRFALNAFVSENYAKAIKYFLKIKELFPEKEGIAYNLGLCYLGEKDYENSEQALLLTLEEEGGSSELQKTLGDLYYAWGRREQALGHYNKFRKLTAGQDIGRWVQVRISLLRSAESMEGIEQANDALALGIKAMKQKKYTQAQDAFVNALTADPSSYQAFNNYGVLLQRESENLQQALKYFEEAVALNPVAVYTANLLRIRKLLADSN